MPEWSINVDTVGICHALRGTFSDVLEVDLEPVEGVCRWHGADEQEHAVSLKAADLDHKARAAHHRFREALQSATRQVMQRDGVSEAQLAAKMGVSMEYVRRFFAEDANPTVKVLSLVAMALGKDLLVGFGSPHEMRK